MAGYSGTVTLVGSDYVTFLPGISFPDSKTYTLTTTARPGTDFVGFGPTKDGTNYSLYKKLNKNDQFYITPGLTPHMPINHQTWFSIGNTYSGFTAEAIVSYFTDDDYGAWVDSTGDFGTNNYVEGVFGRLDSDAFKMHLEGGVTYKFRSTVNGDPFVYIFLIDIDGNRLTNWASSTFTYTTNLSGDYFLVAQRSSTGFLLTGSVVYSLTYAPADNYLVLVLNAPDVEEPSSGNQANAKFTIRLEQASTAPVTVNYTTQDGTATAGPDYIKTSGSLTFAPGQTSAVVNVPVLNDGDIGKNRNFRLIITSATATDLKSVTIGLVGEVNIIDRHEVLFDGTSNIVDFNNLIPEQQDAIGGLTKKDPTLTFFYDAKGGDDVLTLPTAAAAASIGFDRTRGFDAGSGNDWVEGSDEADIILGGEGDDKLFGRGDADLLIGGPGADAFDGGAEFDIVSYGFGGSISLLVGGTSSGDAAGDTFKDIELIVGSPQNDTITWSGGPIMLMGNHGYDILAGGDSNDVLFANGALDSWAAFGNLIKFGETAPLIHKAGLGSGVGGGELRGSGGSDFLLGSAGSDYLIGGTSELNAEDHSPDVIFGRDGNDSILAGKGDQLLYSGSGRDYILSVSPDTGVDVEGPDGHDTISPTVYSQDGIDRTVEFIFKPMISAFKVESYETRVTYEEVLTTLRNKETISKLASDIAVNFKTLSAFQALSNDLDVLIKEADAAITSNNWEKLVIAVKAVAKTVSSFQNGGLLGKQLSEQTIATIKLSKDIAVATYNITIPNSLLMIWVYIQQLC